MGSEQFADESEVRRRTKWLAVKVKCAASRVSETLRAQRQHLCCGINKDECRLGIPGMTHPRQQNCTKTI
jgi:hypothetical protein